MTIRQPGTGAAPPSLEVGDANRKTHGDAHPKDTSSGKAPPLHVPGSLYV